MKRYVINFWCFISSIYCFGNLNEERIEELTPFPFKLDGGFERAFAEQTGYDQVLITEIGIFDTSNYVYCYFFSTARLKLEGELYYGHDAFLARRTKDAIDWSDAEFFMVPSRKVEHLGGTESEVEIDRLIEESAIKATRASVAKRLLLLGGE